MAANVTIAQTGKVITVGAEKNLRNLLIENGIEVISPCGGCASCGKCIVKIVEGDANINEVEFSEKQLLGNVYHMTKERLSCQVEVFGNVTVDLDLHLSVEEKKKKVIRRQKVQASDDEPKEEKDGPKLPSRGGRKRPKAFKTE